MGARPRRAASLRGELEALLRACPTNVPEAGEHGSGGTVQLSCMSYAIEFEIPRKGTDKISVRKYGVY